MYQNAPTFYIKLVGDSELTGSCCFSPQMTGASHFCGDGRKKKVEIEKKCKPKKTDVVVFMGEAGKDL